MNTISRTISGILSALLGVIIGVASLQGPTPDMVIGGLTGLFFIGVGVYIFFNRNEDAIEEVDTE